MSLAPDTLCMTSSFVLPPNPIIFYINKPLLLQNGFPLWTCPGHNTDSCLWWKIERVSGEMSGIARRECSCICIIKSYSSTKWLQKTTKVRIWCPTWIFGVPWCYGTLFHPKFDTPAVRHPKKYFSAIFRFMEISLQEISPEKCQTIWKHT